MFSQTIITQGELVATKTYLVDTTEWEILLTLLLRNSIKVALENNREVVLQRPDNREVLCVSIKYSVTTENIKKQREGIDILFAITKKNKTYIDISDLLKTYSTPFIEDVKW